MRQITNLTRKILTDANAKRIIDWIVPVYGESYVGLWMLQAIGVSLTIATGITESLRTETTVSTANSLLSLWEQHYGLPDGTGTTAAVRRARILIQTSIYGPCNPEKLIKAASAALNGADCYIIENLEAFKFSVRVEDTTITDYTSVYTALKRLKPAHLRMVVEPNFNQHQQLHAKTHTFLGAYTQTEVREDPLIGKNLYGALQQLSFAELSAYSYRDVRENPAITEA